MLTNARLISYTPLEHTNGRGEPVYGVNLAGALMPDCQITEPTRRRVDDPAADQVQADMLVTVPRRLFEVAGKSPSTGDRLVVRTGGLLPQDRQGDVVEVRDADGRSVVLSVKERTDRRGGTGGGMAAGGGGA